MSIRDDFALILSNYLEAKKECGNYPIRQQVRAAFLSLEKKVQNLNAVRMYNNLFITSGMGIGNMANQPWLALLDPRETASTQTGVYCVFLFRADMSGVYFTFNQGVGRTASRAPTKRRIEEVQDIAAKLRKLLLD